MPIDTPAPRIQAALPLGPGFYTRPALAAHGWRVGVHQLALHAPSCQWAALLAGGSSCLPV